MKEYFKLLRIKHYIKNSLVFLPIFFAGKFFLWESFRNALFGFFCFCFISSAVYIFNDYKDVEKDRKHPIKKNRPLASGTIGLNNAKVLIILCTLLACLFSILCGGGLNCFLLVLLYLFLNISYSMGLKNKPIIDVVILASGYIIRVIYGGLITNTQVSKWLYLVITTGSLYMGLGKRRNEYQLNVDSREVLKHYNENFLDKNMYVCATLAEVFYALWTLDLGNKYIIWTVPWLIIILMRYSLDVETKLDGDPVEVIIHDKILLLLVFGYSICIFAMLYIR